MLLKTVILVLIVTVASEDWIKRPPKYFSYPSRFYRKPPPPYVVKGAFSYTPPPNYMQDDEHYRPKVSKKPINDGLGDEDISNLVKHLTKKDLDKIVEFAGVSRYAEKYRDDDVEYKPFRRPESSGYRNEDVDQFSQNIHHFKEQEDAIKVEYNGPKNYGAVRPRILHPTPPSFLDEPNSNYINDASQTKVIYSSPPEQRFSNPNNVFSNPQRPFPSSNPTFYSPHLDTEESMRQYITYVTVPPSHKTNEEDTLLTAPPNYIKDNEYTLFTDSETMQEEQLPKPLNLRDDYEVANTDHVPKVIKADGYKVESFKDLPLMDYDSKLHSVSSYHVPHYLVTSTKSQSPPSSYQQVKVPTIEQAPQGYTGKDMSDAHLKAVKIWTHRSKGTAYTLHDDGSLSLEKPKSRPHSYGYGP
ncbi:hypothetical protein NE865_09617 [Phthorimaea operculella]|nr:hypothetical protein NE865_09617 [Phthorimaea operculella]